jgi:hypothetical protein
MTDISFEEKVRRVDWAKYLEPEYYDPEKMYYNSERLVRALIRLSQHDSLEDKAANESLDSEILFAFGNDHGGTYYPAALEAIDLIIEIQKHSEFEAARNFAACILNRLYYFQLELGSNDKQLYDAIEGIIREKLRPYSDENITNQWT